MNRENRWPLVTDELVEFEKQGVQVQDYRKITDRFREFYRIYLEFILTNQKISTCDCWLGALRILTEYVKKYH